MQINTGIIFTLARKHALPILKLLQITKESFCLNFGMFQKFFEEKQAKLSKAEMGNLLLSPERNVPGKGSLFLPKVKKKITKSTFLLKRWYRFTGVSPSHSRFIMQIRKRF